MKTKKTRPSYLEYEQRQDTIKRKKTIQVKQKQSNDTKATITQQQNNILNIKQRR